MLKRIAGRKHALIVDDEDPWRYVMKSAFHDNGWIVTEAESGEVCLRLLGLKKYDIIFLDYKMPGMNGIETLQGIRKKNSVIPVVIVSGYSDFLNDEELEAYAPITKLSKPMTWRELEDIIKYIT
jgi:CheY-like chemotaxis protein